MTKNWQKENRERANEISRNWTLANPKKRAKVNKNWDQSNKGKKFWALRKRNLGWILMLPNPFANSTLVDYHHVTDTYVVAVPRDLHQLYGGKYHREKVMEIVKQIYLD